MFGKSGRGIKEGSSGRWIQDFPDGGTKLLLAKISRKLHEKKLGRGGACPKFVCLDPSLRLQELLGTEGVGGEGGASGQQGRSLATHMKCTFFVNHHFLVEGA